MAEEQDNGRTQDGDPGEESANELAQQLVELAKNGSVEDIQRVEVALRTAGVLFFLSSAAAFAIFIHYLNAFGEVNAAEVDQDAEKAAGLRRREEAEEQGEA